MSYNRRSFLKTSAAATAGISLAGLPFFSCSSLRGATESKYGIQLYSVRNDVEKNLRGTLEYLAKAGYSQIELYGFDGKSFFGKSPKEFKSIFDELKLTAPSGHYGFDDVLESGKLDSWKRVLEAGNEMGNKYVTIPGMGYGRYTNETLPQLLKLVNEAGELTKAAGLKLAYHNHDHEFKKRYGGQSFLQKMIEGTDPSLVDFEMDLYWAVYANENPLEWFDKYPGRFAMWHVKDLTTNSKGHKMSTQVGDGTIDFSSIFAARQKSGLKYAFVEQEYFTMPEEEAVQRSIAYMKEKKWGNK